MMMPMMRLLNALWKSLKTTSTIKGSLVEIMKILLVLLLLGTPPAHAQEDALSYMSDDQHPGEPLPPEEKSDNFASSPENDDPFESVNRSIFTFNEGVDM